MQLHNEKVVDVVHYVPIRTTDHIVEISWCVTMHDQHGVLCMSFVALRRCPVFERTSKSCLLRFVETASEALRKLDVLGV